MSRPASGLHGFVKLLIETVLCVTRTNFLAEYMNMCYAPSPFRSCCETLHHSKHFLLPTLLELQLHLCSPTCITSAPWTRKMPSRSPCPKAAEARGRRPGAGRLRAWGSRGHFGGRCCLTAGATTDHSPDASRLRHPDR